MKVLLDMLVVILQNHWDGNIYIAFRIRLETVDYFKSFGISSIGNNVTMKKILDI